MGKRAALILMGLTSFAGGVSSLAPWSIMPLMPRETASSSPWCEG